MSDSEHDRDLADFEQRRSANRKTLAIIGLVLVGGLLLWRCTSLVDRFGLGTGSSAVVAPKDLEVVIQRSGRLQTRGCTQAAIEDCVAQAKVRARNGEASNRVVIHVEPDAPKELVRELEALVQSFELVPVVE